MKVKDVNYNVETKSVSTWFNYNLSKAFLFNLQQYALTRIRTGGEAQHEYPYNHNLNIEAIHLQKLYARNTAFNIFWCSLQETRVGLHSKE